MPSSDPGSSISRLNIAKTCGKCHPGADARFASFPVHVIPTPSNQPLLFWISQIYVVLIVTIIGFMFVHNAFDFVKKSKAKLRLRRNPPAVPRQTNGMLFMRMTKSERVQHWGLLVSFTLLVFTGFVLRFPDSWWVKAIREIGGGGERVFELRSLTHRISALIMIATAVYHLYYVIFTKRGRQFIRDMVPKRKDAEDLIGTIKYYSGVTREKPKFDRFSYIEKAEYLALVWGTAVMITTGLLLWFNNFTIGTFTLLGIDVATLIHYYEAILATLAILIWHIYYVIFNPDVYPMNLSWLVGTITEEEMEDEHPLELEKLTSIETEASEGRESGNIIVEDDDESRKNSDNEKKEKD